MQLLTFLKTQLLSLTIDAIEDLLIELPEAGVKLPTQVEKFLSNLRKDVYDKSRIQSNVPALFVHHKLQEVSRRHALDN